MSPTLTLQLVGRHPTLLSLPNGSVIAQRGIECSDGWYGLIDKTLSEIEGRRVSVDSSPPAITQIKEKFGLLRVYTMPSDEPIRAILDAAEQASATCCEQCGREGKLVATPFSQVRCENCLGRNAS